MKYPPLLFRAVDRMCFFFFFFFLRSSAIKSVITCLFKDKHD